MKRLKYVVILLLLVGVFETESVKAIDHYVTSVARGTSSWLALNGENNNVCLPSSEGVTVVSLNTNLNVSVSSRPYWVSMSQIEVGKISLTVRGNTSSTSRTGSLSLKGKDGKTLTLNLIQFGSSSDASVSKSNINLYGDKLFDSLSIVSNVSYTMEIPTWLIKTDKGNGKYEFTAAKIYDSVSRTGEINIKDSTGRILKTVPVNEYYATSDWYEKPCFGVISDIHFGDEDNQGWELRMPRALRTMNAHDPQIRYLYVVGDLANHGEEAQYQDILSYFGNTSLLSSNIKTIFVRGNHDNYNSNGLTYYNNLIKQDINQYLNIQGYPFISIGCNSGDYRGDYCYNETTMAFLKASLADAADKYPNKPIFVFNHVLPKNTVIGSYDNDYNAYAGGLDELFSQYPQVIDISAHTHMGITDPHQIYQKNYTAVNDGSQKMDSNPTHFPNWANVGATSYEDYNCVTEGFVIHINANNAVVIERWNTALCDKYSPDWVISPPFDGTNFTYANRTGGLSPWWESEAALVISNKASTSCYVTFPQAKDDEDVYRYLINVYNSNGTSVMTQINQCALLNRGKLRPSTITMALKNLPSNTQLTCKVVAYDAYDNASPALSTTFTLP